MGLWWVDGGVESRDVYITRTSKLVTCGIVYGKLGNHAPNRFEVGLRLVATSRERETYLAC